MATPKSSTFHQILLNDLSVRIADIYNNDELEEDLKHDIVCRLISKLIGANSVSIILYKGKKDKLLCAGRYIDPIFAQATSVGQKKSKEIVNVMRYIDILEFLTVMKIDDYNSWKNGEVLESIYIQYQNFKFSNPIILNFEEFCSFMEEYKIKSKRKYIDFCYEVYKNHIREDVHYVSLDDPITGCYYYGLTHKNESSSLKNILSLYHSIHVSTGNIILTHLNEFPNNKLCSDNLLSKLKVSISTNALYLGVPLLVNNRPIGILRVLLREFLKFPIPATDNKRTMLLKEQKQERYNFKNNLDAIKYLKEIVNIESLALMLSMLIENLYFINGLRDISLKDALKGDINNLYEIADELTKVVNCYGCIIRLTDQNGNNAAIKGYSEEVKDYIDALNEIGDPYIEKSGALLNVIAKLFYKAGGEDTESADDLRTKVECLKTDFDAEGNPFFFIFISR
jgi:hypothetical protein